MTKSVGVHEAKTHLSRLLDEAAAGVDIVIERRGTPIARLVPIAKSEPRTFGFDRGRFTVPDDFDDPLPDDFVAAFET